MQWIPVEDTTRRPDHKEEVFVILKPRPIDIETGFTEHWPSMATCLNDEDGFRFVHGDDMSLGECVVYWMPIPVFPRFLGPLATFAAGDSDRKDDFVPCPSCSEVGHILCPSCLHNRALIEKLKRERNAILCPVCGENQFFPPLCTPCLRNRMNLIERDQDDTRRVQRQND